MPTGGSVSVIEVARHAGVSVGTVSRVINGHPKVLPINVAAVRDAMAALGYQPLAPENRRGRRSRSVHPAKRVCLTIIGPHDLSWMADRSPIYSYVIHGVQSALADRHLDLVVRHAPHYAQLGAQLRHQRHDGIVLFGTEPGDQPPAELARLPAVWVMGSPRRFHGDHLLPNHLRIGALAAGHLLAAGHRRCAFLGSDLECAAEVLDGAHRGPAFRAAFAAGGGEAVMVADGGFFDAERNRVDEARLATLLDQAFTGPRPPSALFLGMDVFAPSVYRCLHARGLRPGRDLAVLTCNNERPFLAGLDPAPTVIDIRADLIGRRAVERLFWRIDHPDEPAEQILVAPRLNTDIPDSASFPEPALRPESAQ
jgi:LacI family transcriptional regulator